MSLQAGAATRDISPTKPTQLCGYPHVRRISTGIHDPLLASALYLENGSSAVLLCALDLIVLNSEVARRIRHRVASAVDIDEARVLISCTHTHSAPVTMHYLPFRGNIAMPPPDPSYLEFVEDHIVEAAVEAKKNSRPAELAWTSADARGVGGNRHYRDGPADPEVGVLAVRANGELIAVTMIYGMHPTVLHEDSTLVSGDFPFYARLHVQEKFGKDLVVLYHTGAAGNQSPRYHVKGQTFAEAERLGRKLGAAVLTSLAGIQSTSPYPSPDHSPKGRGKSQSPAAHVRSMTRSRLTAHEQLISSPLGREDKGEGCRLNVLRFTSDVTLAGALQSVDLRRRTFPSVSDAEKVLAEYQGTYERLKAEGAERARVRTAEVSVFGAEALLTMAREEASGEIDRLLTSLRPFEVQVLRIDEVCIAALPGEFFVEYSLELKKRAVSRSFMVNYANGELQGYIVTPEAAAVGGYEAASSMFEPKEGMRMVDAALASISELMNKKAGGSTS